MLLFAPHPASQFASQFASQNDHQNVLKLLLEMLTQKTIQNAHHPVPQIVPQQDTSFRFPKRSSSCTQKDHETILKKHSKSPQNTILLLDMPKSR